MQSLQDTASANVGVDLIREGIVRITLKPGARMNADDGAAASKGLLSLTGGKPSVVLLHITGVGSVSREAISVYSEAATVRAFAILGATPVDRVIAHGMLGLPKPPCPTEYFTDEDEAMRWLHGHRP